MTHLTKTETSLVMWLNIVTIVAPRVCLLTAHMRLSCRSCARMEQSTAHCDISDVITDVQAAAEDSGVRPLLPLTVLLRPFASVFCLTL